jgi:charged multivesicular body protein 3
MQGINHLLEQAGLKQRDPAELCKEWQSKLRKEGLKLDRAAREVERDKAKTELEIKALAKRGGQEAAIRGMAKNVIEARKAIDRIATTKAHLSSVSMQMRNQLATIKMGQAFKSSAEAMRSMSALVSAPEVAQSMKELAFEMERAGFMQEIVDDSMAMMDNTAEGEVDAEVDKVIQELTMATLSKAAPAPVGKVRMPATVVAADPEEEEEEGEAVQDEADLELERRLARLQAS